MASTGPGSSNTIPHNSILVHGVPVQNLQQLQGTHNMQRSQQQAQAQAHHQPQAQAQAQAQAAAHHQFITTGPGGSVMKVVPVSSAGSRVTKTTNVNTPLFLAHAGRTSAPQSKYADLLVVIEDMGRDIRPTYAGSRMATERLKRGIVHAKTLVRECLAETERSARN